VKVKKQTELKGFYRFQITEEKMRDLESLRKKFAEDKERVAKMKEQRKFKPF
jgi:ribosomal RNA-processing protein 7